MSNRPGMNKEYKVIKGYGLSNLQEQVEESLALGWQLVGGVTIDAPYYLQAMYKETEETL